MAKGAASSKSMSRLHKTMATILQKTLEVYEKRLDALTALDTGEVEEEMIKALMEANFEPSPAMLGVVAKFLKDNQIEFEAEEINELSAIQKRLSAKKANRPSFKSVTDMDIQGTA